jgi:hypothetical protein
VYEGLTQDQRRNPHALPTNQLHAVLRYLRAKNTLGNGNQAARNKAAYAAFKNGNGNLDTLSENDRNAVLRHLNTLGGSNDVLNQVRHSRANNANGNDEFPAFTKWKPRIGGNGIVVNANTKQYKAYFAGKGFANHGNVMPIRLRALYAVRTAVFKKKGSVCDANQNASFEFLRAARATPGCVTPNGYNGFVVNVNGTHVELSQLKKQWLGRIGSVPMYVRIIPAAKEEEIVRMHTLSRLASCNKVPNFPMMYGAATCGARKNYFVTLSEAFHGTLAAWMKRRHAVQDYVSALAQLLMALATMHGQKLVHAALTPENVVFMAFPQSAAWWQYRVADRDVFIRKTGFLFALNGFSNGQVFDDQTPPHMSPACDVMALLRMFAKSTVPKEVRAAMSKLAVLQRAQAMDAAAFVRNREVLAVLQRLASMAVSTGPVNGVAAIDKFDVLPRSYTPYEGGMSCAQPRKSQGVLAQAVQTYRHIARDMQSALTAARF